LSKLNKPQTERLLTELATKSENDFDLRILATTKLIVLNSSKAATFGFQLLRDWPMEQDASAFFKAFLASQEATKALAELVMKQKVPEAIAMAIRPVFERQIPWGRHQHEDVVLMIKALEASGGIVSTENMPQKLSDEEMASLVLDINRANGDLARGEKVFRKINCVSCHAIGGAGGLMGPDLSSLGTSSPVETIIKSILEPSASIKEGYELQRVARTDGSIVMGYLVSVKSAEIDIRGMSGEIVTIPKNAIEKLEKVSGSLMPAGLTASIEKNEFIDLVSFLSKLGESGDYRVPIEQLVRRWDMASTKQEILEKIDKKSLGKLFSEENALSFSPMYSKVSGDLPIEEIPIIEVGPDQKYSFVRFDLEALSEGNVNIWFNLEAGIKGWVGEMPLELKNRVATISLSVGINQIKIVIDRNIVQEGALSIVIEKAEVSSAQVRLVMGQ
jgi:putative heme-binding domain-containing protein